jgi:hypothetical protein
MLPFKCITSKESVTTAGSQNCVPLIILNFAYLECDNSSVPEQNFCAINVCFILTKFPRKKCEWTGKIETQKYEGAI